MLKKRLFNAISLLMVLPWLFTACADNSISTGKPTLEPEQTQTAEPSPTAATPEATPEQTPDPANTTPDPSKGGDEVEPGGTAKERVKVKAVYVSGPVVSARFDPILELVEKTELNALVIDIKENGVVNYESQVPLVKELGLYVKYYNAEELIKRCHEKGIYVIGRIVTFREGMANNKPNGLAAKNTELAIRTPSGGIWQEDSYGPWLNPYKKEAQDYNIDIAKEAISLGFDEIQFDYVRFPTAKADKVNYGENMPEKTDTITEFLKRAAEEIKSVNADAAVSADVFGIIAESEKDGNAIGQQLERLGLYIDYLSPMIYPSHYANNSKGTMGNGVGQKINGVHFTHPDLEPYNVVYQSLLKVKTRTDAVEGYKAIIRPYLQDFTAKYLPSGYFQTYGEEQVKAQIKAVYDAGYEEWILWNPSNRYTEDALEIKDE